MVRCPFPRQSVKALGRNYVYRDSRNPSCLALRRDCKLKANRGHDQENLSGAREKIFLTMNKRYIGTGKGAIHQRRFYRRSTRRDRFMYALMIR